MVDRGRAYQIAKNPREVQRRFGSDVSRLSGNQRIDAVERLQSAERERLESSTFSLTTSSPASAGSLSTRQTKFRKQSAKREKELEQAESKLASVEQERAELLQRFRSGEISIDEFKADRVPLDRRINKLSEARQRARNRAADARVNSTRADKGLRRKQQEIQANTPQARERRDLGNELKLSAAETRRADLNVLRAAARSRRSGAVRDGRVVQVTQEKPLEINEENTLDIENKSKQVETQRRAKVLAGERLTAGDVIPSGTAVDLTKLNRGFVEETVRYNQQRGVISPRSQFQTANALSGSVSGTSLNIISTFQVRDERLANISNSNDLGRSGERSQGNTRLLQTAQIATNALAVGNELVFSNNPNLPFRKLGDTFGSFLNSRTSFQSQDEQLANIPNSDVLGIRNRVLQVDEGIPKTAQTNLGRINQGVFSQSPTLQAISSGSDITSDYFQSRANLRESQLLEERPIPLRGTVAFQQTRTSKSDPIITAFQVGRITSDTFGESARNPATTAATLVVGGAALKGIATIGKSRPLLAASLNLGGATGVVGVGAATGAFSAPSSQFNEGLVAGGIVGAAALVAPSLGRRSTLFPRGTGRVKGRIVGRGRTTNQQFFDGPDTKPTAIGTEQTAVIAYREQAAGALNRVRGRSIPTRIELNNRGDFVRKQIFDGTTTFTRVRGDSNIAEVSQFQRGRLIRRRRINKDALGFDGGSPFNFRVIDTQTLPPTAQSVGNGAVLQTQRRQTIENIDFNIGNNQIASGRIFRVTRATKLSEPSFGRLDSRDVILTSQRSSRATSTSSLQNNPSSSSVIEGRVGVSQRPVPQQEFVVSRNQGIGRDNVNIDVSSQGVATTRVNIAQEIQRQPSVRSAFATESEFSFSLGTTDIIRPSRVPDVGEFLSRPLGKRAESSLLERRRVEVNRISIPESPGRLSIPRTNNPRIRAPSRAAPLVRSQAATVVGQVNSERTSQNIDIIPIERANTNIRSRTNVNSDIINDFDINTSQRFGQTQKQKQRQRQISRTRNVLQQEAIAELAPLSAPELGPITGFPSSGFTSFRSGGGFFDLTGFSTKGKKKKKKVKPLAFEGMYSPTATAAFFNIAGTESKGAARTGLSLRPLRRRNPLF